MRAFNQLDTRILNKIGGRALNALIANGPVELVRNGTFDDGLNDWTDTSLGAGAASVVGGKAVLTRSPSADLERIVQSAAVVIGKQYRLQFEVSNNNALFLQLGTTQHGTQYANSGSYLIGSQSEVFTATATTVYYAFYCSGVGNENHLDNVSLQAV